MSADTHRRAGRPWELQGGLLALAFGLLASSSLSGCGLGAESGGVPITNSCAEDADCSSSICDRGICIAASSDAMEVALEVLPASASGEAQAGGWIFDVETIEGSSERDLMLPAPLLIDGDVRWNSESIPARITFTRESLLPMGNAISVRTTNEPLPGVDAGGDPLSPYSVEVVAGQTYQVLVQPSAVPSSMGGILWTELLPPLTLTFNAPAPNPMQPGATLLATLPITYPPMITVDGRVLDVLDQPEEDLIVRAVDVESGRTVSSTCLTTATGDFDIVLAADADPFLFVIEGSGDRPEYPRVVIDPALLFPASPVLVHVASMETLTYRAAVEAEDGRPIENAQVLFMTTSIDGIGIGVEAGFDASTSTDNGGDFEVELLPGSYDVIITPSGTSCDDYDCWSTEEVAVLHAVVDVAPRPDGMPVQGRLFVVPERAVMGGSVEGPAGAPMFGLAAQAVARREPLTDEDLPEALYNRSSSAETDPTGLFDLRLDLGRFDLFVRNTPDSAFPWTVVPGLEVDDEDAIFEDFEMRLPVPVRGSASDSRGLPLEGAEVRAHALIDDEGTSRSVLIGTATVAEDGSYELLLPPSL